MLSRDVRSQSSSAVIMVAFLALLALAPHLAAAEPLVTVSEPWSRVTPPGVRTGAGYLTITSRGPADRLVSAESPRARRVEIHDMSMTGGVMKMWQLKDGLLIPDGGSLVLAPGGKHLMFFELERGFVLGEKIPVQLHFEKSGTIRVELVVQPLGAKRPTPPTEPFK